MTNGEQKWLAQALQLAIVWYNSSKRTLIKNLKTEATNTVDDTTAKLQRVLNAAARVVSNFGKYDRGLTHFRRHVLHWLDVTGRRRFRLFVQVY